MLQTLRFPMFWSPRSVAYNVFPWFSASLGSPRESESLKVVRRERQTFRFEVFRESGRVRVRPGPSMVFAPPVAVSVGATTHI